MCGISQSLPVCLCITTFLVLLDIVNNGGNIGSTITLVFAYVYFLFLFFPVILHNVNPITTTIVASIVILTTAVCLVGN